MQKKPTARGDGAEEELRPPSAFARTAAPHHLAGSSEPRESKHHRPDFVARVRELSGAWPGLPGEGGPRLQGPEAVA